VLARHSAEFVTIKYRSLIDSLMQVPGYHAALA
jgi:hypothetical protein